MTQNNYLTYVRALKNRIFNLTSVELTYKTVDSVTALYHEAKLDWSVDVDTLDELLREVRKTTHLALRHVDWLRRKK